MSSDAIAHRAHAHVRTGGGCCPIGDEASRHLRRTRGLERRRQELVALEGGVEACKAQRALPRRRTRRLHGEW